MKHRFTFRFLPAAMALSLTVLALGGSFLAALAADGFEEFFSVEKARSLLSPYGENRKITDEDYDKALAVKCVNGTFVGQKNGDVIAYKGIPFVGQQPVGEYRWKAPVEYAADDGVYEAYYNGKTPCQGVEVGESASLYVQGEDCLYLNIWKVDDASAEKKPVMVWIHGGAFEMGGTVDPVYECSKLVSENPEVIVVSIEYRVGIFGFFHLSHLEDGADYPDAQNLGLLDQYMALRWVHENIAGFGGDPDNVTIFGESAGGASVTLLPLMEGSHAFFHRVIAQSGSPVFTRSPEQAIQCIDEVMESLGCKTVAELQKVPVEDMIAATKVLGLRVWAERDGRIVPEDPYGAYADGAASDLDILQGCNKDEMGYFICGIGQEVYDAFAADRMEKKFAQMTEDERALVEDYLKNVGDVTASYSDISRLFDQITFIAPLFRLSENQTKAGGKSYTYFFTPESSVPRMRSGHAVELRCVFKFYDPFLGRPFDETFCQTMRKMWVQFAKTGDPSLTAEQSPDGKEKIWPLYDIQDRQVMIFDEFDIHAEKESQRRIVDWDRTYFLTKYYCI